jgi:hypothetical protein
MKAQLIYPAPHAPNTVPHKIQMPAYMHVKPSEPEETKLRLGDYIEKASLHKPTEVPEFTPAAWALRHEMEYSGSSLPMTMLSRFPLFPC